MPATIDQIKELRTETGAGVMDCRQALDDADGDLEKARILLREQGVAKAAKRAERETGQGLIESYVHGGRIGVLVDLRCETDFVARTDQFKELAHDLAMQVASMNPQAVAVDQIEDGTEGEPEELALLAQTFIKDPTKTIQDLVNEVVAGVGEKIEVARFVRYELGR